MTDLRDDLQSALGSAYSLERELGGGGMSRVFVAEEMALQRKVVVKVLSPDLMAGVNVDRFRREIHLAARLQHAHIVPVLAAGETNCVPYYTMPFVDGESLRTRVARVGPLPIPEVSSILRDVTRALAYAHDRGVVHRDIKPDNVLLSGGTAVVTDFGIAKAIAAAKNAPGTDISDGRQDSAASLTMLGTSVGTPAYLSPEQAAGDPDIDQRSDIYSFGCMAYEMLAGRPPFEGRSPQRTLVAHLTEKPEPLASRRSDVPPALADLVMRCLEKEPSARPQSAAEIGAALDAVSGALFAGTSNGANGGDARPISAATGTALYAAAFVGITLLAKAAVIVFGLPDWVFSGAVVLMLLGLPPVALAALGATPHVTWSRAARGGAIVLGAFSVAVVAIMALRVLGIGPGGSLLAAGKLHASERLLVIDFDTEKDSSLSHVVTEAVRTNLGQSRVVSIMPPVAIAAALRRMQRPVDAPVDLSTARDLAEREGIKAIVAGTVAKLGAGYVVSIRLVSADSGNELAAYRASVDGTGQLLDAIDQVTRKLRGRIGESLKSVRDAPALDQVTTSSLDALRKYADAVRASDLQGDYATSALLFRQAVARDSNFAMAYRKLGVTLGNLQMPRAQIDSALTRAFQLRDRLPEKERYLAIATYYQSGPGMDRRKAAEAFEQALGVDNSDMPAAVNLANALASRRQFARAESLLRAVNLSDRVTQLSMANYASTLLADGKLAASESVYRELTRRFPAARNAQTYPVTFIYLRGRYDSTEAFWRGKITDANPIIRTSALNSLAALALVRGHLAQARALVAQARAANTARGVPPDPLSDSLSRTAWDIWFLGENEKGVRALNAVMASAQFQFLAPTHRPCNTLATDYAWAGRPDKARALLAACDAAVTDSQVLRAGSVQRHNTLGEILLAEKRPLEAVREFWASDSLPDGPANACAHCIDADLGRAYDLANLPDSAIGHWESFLNKLYLRGPGTDALVLAGIHKRLGELYEAKGNLANAESHYSAFLTLWGTADPELQPKVADVRRRLAALRARKAG